MGWIFPLKSSNIVAFVTDPNRTVAPRLSRIELKTFLGAFEGMPLYEQEKYPWQPRLISSRPDWIDEVAKAAKGALHYVNSLQVAWDEWLEPAAIERALSDFRRLLGDYELFGLAVRRGANSELNAFVQDAAYASKGHAIYLIPDEIPLSFEVLDPFPAIALLAEQPDKWPGVLYWSRRGVAAFCSLSDARVVHSQALELFRQPQADLGAKIDQLLETHQSIGSSKRLLHLSDLHFGTTRALKNQAYLLAKLAKLIPDVHRIVITGDLMQNPTEQDALNYKNFQSSLVRMGKDPIRIPGNHDQKWLGNFGSSLKEMAGIEWTKLVVDDDLCCVFLGFDSARDTRFARGKVTSDQLMDVATMLDTRSISSPEMENYLRVALVHHHPFTFETAGETLIQRGLRYLGLSDERFLRFDDADKFLAWCAGRGIPLVLHGHKHVQRHVRHRVSNGKGGGLDITAVGCGTSLGAEDQPLSYNIVTWDSHSRQWAASFFSDPGDGSGFARQYIATQLFGRS